MNGWWLLVGAVAWVVLIVALIALIAGGKRGTKSNERPTERGDSDGEEPSDGAGAGTD